jgi:hypothetical protein
MQTTNASEHIFANRTCIDVGYFYSDGTIKYDEFSMSQINGTISKKTIHSHKDTTQRYLDRLG